MKRAALDFKRPEHLAATAPPKVRGLSRDEVRLLVSTTAGHAHARFRDLPDFLDSGDVLVYNKSATLPASLPATGSNGDFILNLCTHYGNGLWLAEPRLSRHQPGPLPLYPGEYISAGGIVGRLVAAYPGLPRLWFVHFREDMLAVMAQAGTPIRYGYLEGEYPLAEYQTIFAEIAGSAEMPSAAYPFTPDLRQALWEKSIEMVGVVLHTGVSSLEIESDDIQDHVLYPEPFEISPAVAGRLNVARAAGRRIIAIGTTVVRALEAAWQDKQIVPMAGFTRYYVQPARAIHVVNGLLTGFHDPVTSHLAMLYTIAGEQLVQEAYAEAVRAGYLWHEFGDSHLILPYR